METLTWIAIAAAGALVVGYLVLVFWALVQIVRTTSISLTAKVVWALLVLCFVPLGTMAWYLFGHRTPDYEQRLRTSHVFNSR